jgi:hypothetical protein
MVGQWHKNVGKLDKMPTFLYQKLQGIIMNDLSNDEKRVIELLVDSRSVSELIKGHKHFRNTAPLPNRADFYKGTVCECCGKESDYDADAAEESYKAALKVRRDNGNFQKLRFKYATFYELGLENMWYKAPAKIAWEIAWDDGHSAGLYEVYNRMQTLSRILNVM